MGLVFGFLAWAPYTKLLHPLTAVLNIYTAPLTPIGSSLHAIDFDKDESLGVNALSSFTWKDLLDLDACTECGRCTAVCPANAVGKLLSPRDLILDLRHLSRTRDGFSKPIIDATPALSPEALWACTTCGACVESCPVSIAQMPKIVDMRRHLAMEEAVLPDTMGKAIGSLESRGHPYAGTQFSRLDWMKGLQVPQRADIQGCDVLLWVGCGGMSFVDEPANQRVNQERARQVLETGADVVAVGCPFCMTMLEDGVNAVRSSDPLTRPTKVLDVAELLWDSVRDEPTTV